MIESLDYEIGHEFYLTVEATDGGTPPLSDMATVNINLTDVNDNSPVFSQGVYSAVVSEDSELGKTVMAVRVSLPLYVYLCCLVLAVSFLPLSCNLFAPDLPLTRSQSPP